MTNEAFNEFVATVLGFLALYTWAILFVFIGIAISVKLAKEMDKLSRKIVSFDKPEEKYSKKSIEGWMNTMYSVWKIGLGSLVPCFMIYSVSRYLPKQYLSQVINIENSQIMISQAFLLMQAIVFFILLSIKYRALAECYCAMSLAKESGI